MNKTPVAFLCGALMWQVGHAFAAQNVVGQAVQKLHLSPQQLLSLRDFLGAFSRGAGVDASEDGLFILRDTATMAYVGEFSLRVNSGGRLEIDRIAGPARLDTSRAVPLPLRLTDKARAQAIAALANSEATKTGGPAAAENMERIGPPSALAGVSVSAANLTDAATPGNLTQSRAEFWPDGSGWSASVRLQSGLSAMRVTERFFAPIRADATQVWRDRMVEINGDLKLPFAELENRYACGENSTCIARYVPAESGLHIIRWGKTLVSAVPPSLLAQIAMPPVNSAIVQAPAQTPAQENETTPDAEIASPARPDENVPGSPNGR